MADTLERHGQLLEEAERLGRRLEETLTELRQRYGPAGLDLAEELVQRAALVVDNARLREQAEREIAGRLQAEDTIRFNEIRYRTIFEATPDAVVVLDNQGRFLDVNESMCQTLKAPRERLVGASFREFVPSHLRGEAETGFERLRTSGFSEGEFPLRAMDGSIVEMEWRSRANIVPGQHFCAARDITARKRAEEALRESEARLRAVFDTVVDGIITIDERGVMTTINPAVERIFGFSAPEMVGSNIKMLMPEPYRSEHDAYLRNYLNTGIRKIIGIGREVQGIRKNGGVFPLYLAVSETRIEERRMFTGIVRDITDRKQAEQSLARQARELEKKARELARSNAELESFASVVSHDLRSPLVTISGCAQLLEAEAREKLGPESAELIRFIRDSVDHMGAMIKSLLDYARLGAEGLKLAPCDCEQVLGRVLHGLKSVLVSGGAEVTHDPLPTIQADEALFGQLLQNLIENGIKYGGDSPPRVHVSARTDLGEWVFSVRDNGIGIAPEHFPRIFQIFQRLHQDESKYSGNGIGLATSKKIVEAHGGRIWVESCPGEGATFSFAIPQ